MKINYKNTALDFLDNPENIDFHVPEYHGGKLSEYEKLKVRKDLKDIFIKAKQEFGGKTGSNPFCGKIRYISVPFMLAYEKWKHKLASVFDREVLDEDGTIIFQTGSWTTTVFYSIETNGIGKDWEYQSTQLWFSKHSKADYKSLDVFIRKSDTDIKSLIWEGHMKQNYDSGYFNAWLVTFLCFIKYCEVEVKVCEPNRKAHHKGEKYVNETKQRVEIMDSTWFTTITTSKGFSVGAEEGGFFRMQVHGPNNSLRKLKWIDAFEKEGYHRTAKVLTQDQK